MSAKALIPRATRYAIPLSIFYRRPGESTWAEGRTENISKSGVLVRGDRPMPPNAPIEMLLSSPSDIQAPFAGTTICQGRIVRTVPSDRLENRAIFAASILKFESPLFVDPRRI